MSLGADTRVYHNCGWFSPAPAAGAVPGHPTMLMLPSTSAAPAAGSAAGQRGAAVLPALAQPPIPPTGRRHGHHGLGAAEQAGSRPAPVHTHRHTHHTIIGLGMHTSNDEERLYAPLHNLYLEETF